MNETEFPIRDILETAIRNIKNVSDASTVVGEPIVSTDGTTVIPVSKVSLGFAAGGSDFATKEQAAHGKASFGGGSGAGVSVTPLAFLVISPGGNVEMLPVNANGTVSEKLLDILPDVINKVKEYLRKK